jgi:hypothetical protein
MSFRLVVAVLVSTTALLLIVGDAGAASKSCHRSGLKVAERQGEATLYTRLGRHWYEPGGMDQWVCSSRYRKLIRIGGNGLTGDGAVWARVTLAGRYVAVVNGSSGNADAGTDETIDVIDLKSGREVSSSKVADAGQSDEVAVQQVVVNARGEVGWTAIFFRAKSDPAAPGGYTDEEVVEVNVRKGGEKAPTQLAVGTSIDQWLLRWSEDGTTLLWADPSSTFRYPTVALGAPTTDRKGNCARGQGRLVERDGSFGSYYERREVRGAWRGTTSLVGCSPHYKHRVVIAHSGTRGNVRHEWTGLASAVRFVAVASRTTTEAGDLSRWVDVYDLGRKVRTCHVRLDPLADDPTKLPMVVDRRGVVAWTEVIGGVTHLRLCVRGTVVQVAEGAGVDSGLLRLDSEHKTLFYSAAP